MAKKQRLTFRVGDWRPDLTAPILDATGNEVGEIVRSWNWFDVRVDRPDGGRKLWSGGKKLSKALDVAATVYAGMRGAEGDTMVAYYLG